MDTFCIEMNEKDLENKEAMDALNDFMDEWQDAMVKYILEEAKRLGVSDKCAGDIIYLRTRSRWTQELEDELIRMDKAGEPAPNMCDYGCNGGE